MDRPYTKLEAMVSLTFDYDQNNHVTVAGYASLWRWSRKKVAKFIDDAKAQINYPEETGKKQNQKGQIGLQIRDRSGTDKEQMILIDNKCLPTEKNRPGTDEEQIRNRSGSTTKDTKILDTKKEPKTLCAEKAKQKKIKFDPIKFKPDFLEEKIWADAIETRKLKKLQNTELALKPFVRELELAIQRGFTPEECIEEFATSKWTRFKAEWMKRVKVGNESGLSAAGQRTAAASMAWLQREREVGE